jgi:hypothetical protein
MEHRSRGGNGIVAIPKPNGAEKPNGHGLAQRAAGIE